jgi:hypothetical protein
MNYKPEDAYRILTQNSVSYIADYGADGYKKLYKSVLSRVLDAPDKDTQKAYGYIKPIK